MPGCTLFYSCGLVVGCRRRGTLSREACACSRVRSALGAHGAGASAGLDAMWDKPVNPAAARQRGSWLGCLAGAQLVGPGYPLGNAGCAFLCLEILCCAVVVVWLL